MHCHQSSWRAQTSKAIFCALTMPNKPPDVDAAVVPWLSWHAESPEVVADWDVPLSGSEDESLVFAPPARLLNAEMNKLLKSVDRVEYKRPTGIKTLAEWGGLKFPPNVPHGGHSFRVVLAYQKKYCRSILNKPVRQTYLKSFQQYMRAMENSRRISQKRREIAQKNETEKDSDSSSDSSDRSSITPEKDVVET